MGKPVHVDNRTLKAVRNLDIPHAELPPRFQAYLNSVSKHARDAEGSDYFDWSIRRFEEWEKVGRPGTFSEFVFTDDEDAA